MRYSSHIAVLILVAGLFGQSPGSALQSDAEWKAYTGVQKTELVSLANLLYNNENYEQALLAFFQFIYRYPGDRMEPAAYYYIGKCYEKSGLPSLAESYYQRLLTDTKADSAMRSYARYRLGLIWVMSSQFERSDSLCAGSRDPYLMTIAGVARMRAQDWTSARQALKSAEARFNQNYYSEQFQEFYDAMDRAQRISGKRHWLTLALSVFPGGGWAYLGDWRAAAGALLGTTVPILLSQAPAPQIQPVIRYDPGLNMLVPRLTALRASGGIPQTIQPRPLMAPTPDLVGLGLGIYLGSGFYSVKSVRQENRRIVQESIDSAVTQDLLDRIFRNTDPVFDEIFF